MHGFLEGVGGGVDGWMDGLGGIRFFLFFCGWVDEGRDEMRGGEGMKIP